MIFNLATLEGIARGEVTLAFRRWQRPQVRVGGTLTSGMGVVEFTAVDMVHPASVTDAEARAAGYADVLALAEADRRGAGDLYRIGLRYLGADPRIALREQAALGAAEQAEIATALDRLDNGRAGPWTRAVLRLIGDREMVRAAELCRAVGMDMPAFKRRVRQLKELGLTESLEVGYRLSPRGKAFLASRGGGGGE